MTNDEKIVPAAKPTLKRRWFQFSLRTLLIGTAVIGGVADRGLRWIAPAQRQRAAVQMVERLGGSVTYADAQAKGSWIVTRLRDWLPRDYVDNVVGVSFIMTQVADADLVHLNGFRNLVQLELSGTAVTDEGLTHLRGLTLLRVIYLDGTQVTDVGLIHLKGLASPEGDLPRQYSGDRRGVTSFERTHATGGDLP